MTMLQYTTHDVHKIGDWQVLAKNLLAEAAKKRVWAISGDLGSGKTTLVQALCQYLGVRQKVTSPTFTLVHSYTTMQEAVVHHLDAYRIKTPKEALEIGIESYLTGDHYCFIEWPERITSLLPATYFSIQIEAPLSGKRHIRAAHHFTSDEQLLSLGAKLT